MNYHILTLFPEMVTQGLSESILGRAAKKGLLSVNAVNIRDYTADRHISSAIRTPGTGRRSCGTDRCARCM